MILTPVTASSTRHLTPCSTPVKAHSPRAATQGSAVPAEGRSSMRPEEDAGFDLRAAFAAHGPALFSLALSGLGDRSEAQDCVQDAFIRAWRHQDRYRSDKGSVRSWLFAIERNLIIDALRARARRPAPSDAEKIEWATEPVTEDRAIVERIVIYEALATLTAEHRQVITAVRIDGVAYQELSDQTGIPVATLRTRMYYGLKSLRAALGDDAHDPEYSRTR